MSQRKKTTGPQRKGTSDKPDAAAKLKLHQRACTVCNHAKRQEVENAFVSWESPAKTAEEHGLTRDAIYRHAHALGLLDERRKNVRRALERIIERVADVEVTSSAVVAAVQAYAKINASGEWVDRTETVSLPELFSRMTSEELDTYAKSGSVPAWWQALTGATAGATQRNSQGGVSHGR